MRRPTVFVVHEQFVRCLRRAHWWWRRGRRRRARLSTKVEDGVVFEAAPRWPTAPRASVTSLLRLRALAACNIARAAPILTCRRVVVDVPCAAAEPAPHRAGPLAGRGFDSLCRPRVRSGSVVVAPSPAACHQRPTMAVDRSTPRAVDAGSMVQAAWRLGGRRLGGRRSARLSSRLSSRLGSLLGSLLGSALGSARLPARLGSVGAQRSAVGGRRSAVRAARRSAVGGRRSAVGDQGGSALSFQLSWARLGSARLGSARLAQRSTVGGSRRRRPSAAAAAEGRGWPAAVVMAGMMPTLAAGRQ